MKEKLLQFRNGLLAALGLSAAHAEIVDCMARYLQGEEIRMGCVQFPDPDFQHMYREIATRQTFDYCMQLRLRLDRDISAEGMIQLIEKSRALNAKLEAFTNENKNEVMQAVAQDELNSLFDRLGIAGHA